jgi:hypothetical protein
MKIPSAGWAFFGLVAVVLIGYVLNRGLYVGSSIGQTAWQVQGPTGKAVEPYYSKHCHYLYFNGVRSAWANSSLNQTEAENAVCSPLKDSNWAVSQFLLRGP